MFNRFSAWSLIASFLASGTFDPAHLAAAPLTSIENAHELPGYLTFNQNSQIYKDFLKLKNHKDGREWRSPSRMLKEDFVDGKGRVRISAIESRIAETKKWETAAFMIFCEAELKADDVINPLDCRHRGVHSDLEKKWAKKTMARVFKFIIQEFQRSISLALKLPALVSDAALNSETTQPFLESLFAGLQVLESAKYLDRDRSGPWANVEREAKGLVLKKIKIKNRPTSVNLAPNGYLRVVGQMFLNPDSIKAAGLDPSALDPIPSGFWSPPLAPVGKFDMTNYNGQADTIFGAELANPEREVDLEYSSTKGGGSTPKFEIKYGNRLYKMKFGLEGTPVEMSPTLADTISNFINDRFEMQAESVVNNIATALGFTIDPTYYKKSARLYFPKDGFSVELVSTSEGVETYRKTFEAQRTKLIRDLTEKGQQTAGAWRWNFASGLGLDRVVLDENQRRYISLKGIALELKDDPEVFMESGFYAKENFGRSMRREFRAFNLFLALVSDVDTKDANSSMELLAYKKKDGKIGYKVGYSAADMGASFGNFVGKARPNYFGYDLVKDVFRGSDGKALEFSLLFRTVTYSKAFDGVGIEDAKWLVRRLAQISPEQIKKSFLAVEVPEYAAHLFAQKFARRIDQLVQALDIQGTTVSEDITGETRTLRLQSEIKDPKKYAVPGFEELFDDGVLVKVPKGDDIKWAEGLKKFPKGTRQAALLRNGLNLGGAVALGAIGKTLQRIPISTEVFAEAVQVGVNSFLPARYLVQNPNPETGSPFWIIDVFRIGVGGGTGFSAAELLKLGPPDEFEHSPVMVGAVKTYEFMRIHAVSDSSQTWEGLARIYRPDAAIGMPFSSLSESLISSLEPEDAFVSSTYLTFSAQGILDGPVLGPFGVHFGAGAHTTKLRRLSIFKEGNGRLLAEWENSKDLLLKGDATLSLLFIKYPILQGKFQLMKTVESLYRFNPENPEEKQTLLENLVRDVPENIESVEAISKRQVVTRTTGTYFNFFSLFSNRRESQSTRISAQHRADDTSEDYLWARTESKRTRNPFLFHAKSGDWITDAVRNKDGKWGVRFASRYTKKGARPIHFVEAMNGFLPVASDRLLIPSTDELAHYIGSLELTTEVLINHKGLMNLLTAPLTFTDLCQSYFKHERRSDRVQLCGRSFAPFDIQKLMRDNPDDQAAISGVYELSRQLAKTRAKVDKGNFARALGELTQAFHVGKHPRATILTLQDLAGEENVYRNFDLFSSLSFLPGQEQRMELPANIRGGMKPKEVEDLFNGLPKLLTDSLSEDLSPLFFDHAYRNKRSPSLNFRFQ